MGDVMGAVSGVAGMFGGGGGGIDFDAREYAEEANKMLDAALERALPYAENFTQKALDEARQAGEQARNDLQSMYEQGMAIGQPYREAGYRALDQYQDTLGMARPTMSSSRMAAAGTQLAKQEAARREAMSAMQNFVGGLGIDPSTQQSMVNSAMISRNPAGLSQAIQDYINRNPRSISPGLGLTAQPGEGQPPLLPSERLTSTQASLDKLLPVLMRTGMQKQAASNALPATGLLSNLKSGF